MKRKHLLISSLMLAAVFLLTACGSSPAQPAPDASAPSAAEDSVSSAADGSAAPSETAPDEETQDSSAILTVSDAEPWRDESGDFSADLVYPVISDANGDELEVNAEIAAYIDGLKSVYEENKQQEGGVYSVSTSYEVTCDNERYLSLRLLTTEIMASGTQTIKAFTIDKSTLETVSLADLLGNDEDRMLKIDEEIRRQMREQTEQDPNITYFDEGMDGFSGISEDTSFSLDESGNLVILFDEYEIAPGSMGPVSFTIPESVAGKFA